MASNPKEEKEYCEIVADANLTRDFRVLELFIEALNVLSDFHIVSVQFFEYCTISVWPERWHLRLFVFAIQQDYLL